MEFENRRYNPEQFVLMPNRMPITVVVLGKNINIGVGREQIRNSRFQLSPESQMNAIAAGAISQPQDVLIYSTGYTAGRDVRSEADAMWQFTKLKFPHVSESNRILEEESYNTYTNGSAVVSILRLLRQQEAFLLSVSHHLPRATERFNAYGQIFGIHFTPIRSEEIIDEKFGNNLEVARRLRNYRKLDRVKAERIKEQLLRIEGKIDSGGIVPKLLTMRRNV